MVSLKYPQNRIEIGKMMTSPATTHVTSVLHTPPSVAGSSLPPKKVNSTRQLISLPSKFAILLVSIFWLVTNKSHMLSHGNQSTKEHIFFNIWYTGPEYHQNWTLTKQRKTLKTCAVLLPHKVYMRKNSVLRNKKNVATKPGEHLHFFLFRKTKNTISEYMQDFVTITFSSSLFRKKKKK